MAVMVNLGLHVFHPRWQHQPHGTIPRGKQYSTTFKAATLKAYGQNEEVTFPVQTCTRVRDVKDAVAMAAMVDPSSLEFVVKRGCSARKLLDSDEMATVVTVTGLKSFKPQPHRWPHPVAVIGAGYNGIKTLMLYLKSGQSDIVAFDRFSEVGGYCWIQAANKTSKLQTEFAAFHVWWGAELLREDCGYPRGWETWPKRDQVLAHMRFAAERHGVLPHVRFRSNVARMDFVGGKKGQDRHFVLSVTPVGGNQVTEVPCSVMYCFPGCMVRNRIIDYPGEETFEGHIAYGMNDDTPYEKLQGSRVAILGNGAFAVENVRTCCEHAAEKVFLVTRRKNLPSPRFPCWFVHQGPAPTPAPLLLKMFEPMFACCGWDDPWSYHSVQANADRSRVQISSGSRFGIGDVTFLAFAYGKLEYVQDTLKRVSRHTLHLNSGQRLDDIQIILKSLGLLGDYEFDRLQQMKQVHGHFCDGDFRRVVNIDPVGMHAANFTTFSTGIGSKSWISAMKYLHDFPLEYYQAERAGLMDQLPVNKVDLAQDRPCYIFHVQFAGAAAVILESLIPRLGQVHVLDPEYKHKLYHAVNPLPAFLDECRADWDKYQRMFTEQGCTHDYIPYPYTMDSVEEFFAMYNRATGLSISPLGPPSESLQQFAAPRGIGDVPAWAQSEAGLAHVDQLVGQHLEWWRERSSKHDLFCRAGAPPGWTGLAFQPEAESLQVLAYQ